VRSVTANELAVLLKQERAAHARVKVLRSGTWVNLSDLEGRDWVHEVRIQDSVDAACVQFKATLELAQFFLNLSPFMDASKLNAGGALIVLNRPVVVEMAVVPLDVQPQEADWHEVFRGAIDAYKINRSTIAVSGRDQGGRLLNTWMETQKVYGTSSGVRAELIMQDLLDDYSQDLEDLVATYTWNGTTTVTTSDTSEVDVGDYVGLTEAPLFEIASIVPGTSITISNPSNRTIPTGSSATVWIAAEDRVTLYAVNGTAVDPLYRNGGTWDDSPNWLVKTFKQGKRRLLTALQEDIARQIGWQVRYRWHPNLEAFALTFYEPDRSKTTPDEEFSEDFIADLSEVGSSIADIRNRVRVTYGKADDRTTTTRNDTSSQDKYDIQAMDIAESSSSLIDTLTEANALGDAALSDLAEPTALAGFVLPLFWPAEVGDLYRWLATSRYFDSDQDLAVSSVVHAVSRKQASRTTVEVRGKPSGGLRRWLELETLPGIAPEADHYADAAASNVAIESGLSGIVVTYDDPRTMDPPIDDWAYTRCHVATSSGFTPSAANLKAVGKQTRFEVVGLVPGQTYYAKLIIIDEAGNVAATSTQVSVATQLVGPYHTNREEERTTLNANPNFGIHTLDETTTPPDAWSTDDTWGTGAGEWYFDSDAADTRTGDRSVKIISFPRPGSGTTTRSFDSDLFTVDPETLLGVRFEWKHGGEGGATHTGFTPQMRFYDGSGGALGSWVDLRLESSMVGVTTGGSGGTWYKDRGWIVSHSSARYAKLRIYIEVPYTFADATHPTVYFDRFNVVRSSTWFTRSDEASYNRSAATGTWVAPWLFNNGFDQWGTAWTPGSPSTPSEHEYEFQEDTVATVFGQVVWQAMGSGSTLLARIVDASTGSPLHQAAPVVWSGSGEIMATVLVLNRYFSRGDTIRLEGWQNSGSARTIEDPDCRLEITQNTGGVL
jgi:hypothetical protein